MPKIKETNVSTDLDTRKEIQAALGITPTFAGCDPGQNGAIVYFRATCAVCISLANKTDREIWDAVRLIPPGSTVVVEKNTGYVGVGGIPPSSQFKFGASYGKLLMAFTAADIRVDEQVPQAWHKFLAIRPREKGEKKMVPLAKGKRKGQLVEREIGGESRADFKRRLRKMAEQLFASTISLEVADAYLIALYCKRKWGGA